MKLAEYLATAPKGEQARLARAVGVQQVRIADYRLGRRKPTVAKAIRIAVATDCAVRPEDLLDEDWGLYRRALRVKARVVED